MEKSQCIPGHTYEYRENSLLTCSGVEKPYDSFAMHSVTLYYHASVLQWLRQALDKLQTWRMTALAQQVKATFEEDLMTVMQGQVTPGCCSFDQAWEYFVDGTWGKCLKNIDVNCLAQKELARKFIASCMPLDAHAITEQVRQQLKQAVETYIAASLPFDPLGQRHQVAADPIDKFDLDIVIDHRYRLR